MNNTYYIYRASMNMMMGTCGLMCTMCMCSDAVFLCMRSQTDIQ